MPNVKPIPDGYHTLTPYFTVPDLKRFFEFLERAFGATITYLAAGHTHGEAKIGDSMIMAGQARDEYKAQPMSVYLYVEDTDAWYRRAVEAGATSIMEPADQFYGDRNGGVRDEWGNGWWIATHVEDLSPEEIDRRAKASGRG